MKKTSISYRRNANFTLFDHQKLTKKISIKNSVFSIKNSAARSKKCQKHCFLQSFGTFSNFYQKFGFFYQKFGGPKQTLNNTCQKMQKPLFLQWFLRLFP